MYALVINDKEYQLPDKLTVRQWMDIASLNTNFDDYKLNMVAVALGIDSLSVKQVPQETVDLVVSFILVMFSNDLRVSSELEVIDFKSLTFGQWIDLDVYLTEGLDRNLDKIVNILYEQEDSNDMHFTDIIGGVNNYINYRNHIYAQYKGLFGSDYDEVEEEKIPAKPQHPSKPWNTVLMMLADDDITKTDEILEMPLIKVFNFMAYRKEKAYREYLQSQKLRQ